MLKKLGYNWMSLLRKETRQKVIDKVIKFRMSKILNNAKMDSLMAKKKYEQLKKMEDEIKREHKRIMKNEQLKMMEDEIKRVHKKIMNKQPKTKIEKVDEALQGYVENYKISIKNEKDPLSQLQNTRKAIEHHISNLISNDFGVKFVETLKVSLKKIKIEENKQVTDYRTAYFNSEAKTIKNNFEIHKSLQLSKNKY